MRQQCQSRANLDWTTARERIDLAAVTTGLLGPVCRTEGRRLLWPCPFHDDHNPSLVVDPVSRRWRCYPCGIGGDVAELIKRRLGLSFPEAVAYLTGRQYLSVATKPRPSPQPRPAPKPPAGPSGMPLEAALFLVAEAEARLWRPEGYEALAYLTGPRRLTLGTIKAAGLGWTPRADGVAWKPAGLVIPWRDSGRLARVKVRPDEDWRMSFSEDRRPPKYLEAFGGRPSLYPGRHVIRPGRPLVIAEGELDALLLGQELDGLASVVTLGGIASSKPEPAVLGSMLFARPWFVATDADRAGDKAAAAWEWTRAERVKPPEGKDWTDSAKAGVNLCRWWADFLGVPWTPYSWDHLDGMRWGPAAPDPEPSIDRPESDPPMDS